MSDWINLQGVVIFYLAWLLVMLPYWITKEAIRYARERDDRADTSRGKLVASAKTLLIVLIVSAGGAVIGGDSFVLTPAFILLFLPPALVGLRAGYKERVVKKIRGNN